MTTRDGVHGRRRCADVVQVVDTAGGRAAMWNWDGVLRVAPGTFELFHDLVHELLARRRRCRPRCRIGPRRRVGPRRRTAWRWSRGGFVPAPVPIGGGTAAGAGNRWRRTTGPGLFDNDPKGTRGGGRAGAAGAVPRGDAAQAGGAKPDAADRSAARPGGSATAEGARGTAGARGAAGTPAAAMGGAGGARKGEDDTEHKTPDYLLEPLDIDGDDRTVVPPVIGEDPPEDR